VREALDAGCPEDMTLGAYWHEIEGTPERERDSQLWEEWNAASQEVDHDVGAILAAEATTLFGIGVKLAALATHPQGEDYQDAVNSALADIARVTGTDFRAERNGAVYLGGYFAERDEQGITLLHTLDEEDDDA
jgi:hypothetical protein